MDNIFEVSRFDKNILVIGYASQAGEYSFDEMHEIYKTFKSALPNIEILFNPLSDQTFMIKETL